MTRHSLVLGMLAALAATDASAQVANLTGIFTCVEKCRGRSACPDHAEWGIN